MNTDQICVTFCSLNLDNSPFFRQNIVPLFAASLVLLQVLLLGCNRSSRALTLGGRNLHSLRSRIGYLGELIFQRKNPCIADI